MDVAIDDSDVSTLCVGVQLTHGNHYSHCLIFLESISMCHIVIVA